MDSLGTVAVVPLDNDDLLCNVLSLLGCAETDDASSARVRLLVSVGNTHTTTDGNVEAFEFTIWSNNGDETEVIGEDIHVIGGGNGDGNLELKRGSGIYSGEGEEGRSTLRGK